MSMAKHAYIEMKGASFIQLANKGLSMYIYDETDHVVGELQLTKTGLRWLRKGIIKNGVGARWEDLYARLSK